MGRAGKNIRSDKRLTTSLDPARQAELEQLVARLQDRLEMEAEISEAIELLQGQSHGDAAWNVACIEALAHLPRPQTAVLLTRHFGFHPDKLVQKAVKRALHRLRARGVAVPDMPAVEAASIMRPLSVGPIEGFVSPIDGDGNRMLILQASREKFGFSIMTALLHEAQGLKNCYLLSLNKQGIKEFFAEMEAEVTQQVVKIPGAYAIHLLEEALELAPTAPGGAEYRQVRQQLREAIEDQPWPAEGDHLPVLTAEETAIYLERSGDLVKEDIIFGWMPAEAEMAPWAEKIQAVKQSPIILSPEQQKQRVDEIIGQAVGALYDEPRRGVMSCRLREMAYYYDRKGRPDLARWAQAAGEDLQGPASELRPQNPFLLNLVLGALMVYLRKDEAAAEGEGAPLLTGPDSPLILR